MSLNDNKFMNLDENERRTISILYGYLALYRNDYKNFKLYKEAKNEIKINEFNLLEMSVLDSLSNLGFPMDDLGTYFYKDVIMALKPYLDKIINYGIVELYDYLKEYVEQPYGFYLTISRNQNEMPALDFHKKIMDAIDRIDESKIDKSTVYQIFGENTSVHSYGEAAIKIGLYSFGMRKHEKNELGKMPKIKKISGLKK